MKREELKELGLTDEVIEKVMGIHGQDINSLKNDLAAAKATIKTKETEINEIKAAGDPKDWESKYNALKTEKEKAESEFSNYKRNSVIKEKLGSKYHNNDLVLEQILKGNADLKLNDKNEIEGLDEIISNFDKANPYLLKETGANLPQFLGGVSNNQKQTANPNQTANDALRAAFAGEAKTE